MNRVVYATRGGNTERLAKAVAKGAGTVAIPVEEFVFSEAVDTLLIGASIYAGAIDGRFRSFLSALRPGQAKRVVVFGTSAGKKTALTEIKAILEPNGLIVMEDEFHCMGAFLFANRGRPNEEDIERAELFARTICGGQL